MNENVRKNQRKEKKKCISNVLIMRSNLDFADKSVIRDEQWTYNPKPGL